MANLLLSIMGVFVEFERAIIRERQLEGIALANKHGVYTGLKKALDEDQIKSISEKLTLCMKKSEIAKELNMSRETLNL